MASRSGGSAQPNGKGPAQTSAAAEEVKRKPPVPSFSGRPRALSAGARREVPGDKEKDSKGEKGHEKEHEDQKHDSNANDDAKVPSDAPKTTSAHPPIHSSSHPPSSATHPPPSHHTPTIVPTKPGDSSSKKIPAKTVMVPSRYMSKTPTPSTSATITHTTTSTHSTSITHTTSTHPTTSTHTTTSTRPSMGIPPEKKPAATKPSAPSSRPTPTLTIPLTALRSKTPDKNAPATERNSKTPTKSGSTSVVSTPRPGVATRPISAPIKKAAPTSGRLIGGTTLKKAAPTPKPGTAKDAPKTPGSPTKPHPPTPRQEDMILQLNHKIAELQNQLKSVTHERDQLQLKLFSEDKDNAPSEGSEPSNWDELSMGSLEGNSENSSELGDERDEKYIELIKRYRNTLSVLLQKISLFKTALNDAKSEYDALREKHNQLLASHQQSLSDLDRIKTSPRGDAISVL